MSQLLSFQLFSFVCRPLFPDAMNRPQGYGSLIDNDDKKGSIGDVETIRHILTKRWKERNEGFVSDKVEV